jgi:guanylate kinase
MQTRGQLFIISAPSGSGKTTLGKLLLKSRINLEKSVSVTTRQSRKKEKEGEDYFFISEDEFFKRKENGEFLEWAKVLDHYYATPKREVEKNLKKGKNILLSIDVQGTKQIKEIYPDAVCIFIKPPDLTELEKRLRRRKTDKPEDIKKRLQLAEREMDESSIYDYIVINDKIEKAVDQLKTIIKKHI